MNWGPGDDELGYKLYHELGYELCRVLGDELSMNCVMSREYELGLCNVMS